MNGLDKVIIFGICLKIASCLLIDWQFQFAPGMRIANCNACDERYSGFEAKRCIVGCNIRNNLGFIVNEYAGDHGQIDTLVFNNPPIFQTMNTISAAFFLGFYLLYIIATFNHWNWIRIPTMIYFGASQYAMTIYLTTVLSQSEAPWFVFAVNLPWVMFPVLMVYRMRQEPWPATKSVKQH